MTRKRGDFPTHPHISNSPLEKKSCGLAEGGSPAAPARQSERCECVLTRRRNPRADGKAAAGSYLITMRGS
jgi:hypothetical protein